MSASLVPMPKTSVDKYDLVPPWKYKVRTSGKFPNVQAVTESEGKEKATYRHLRPRVLTSKLREIAPGRDEAAEYHRTSMSILELVFYPDVVSPKKEREINQGRKRVDFTMENAAESGFFFRLPTTHRIPSSYIFIECKNYSTDVANPELDQLAGRFDVNKGQVGLMLCRTVDDMPLLLQRCADAFGAKREVLLPLTDDDLNRMLDTYLNSAESPYEALLSERLRTIVDR